MSELEPTLTSSDRTATEELRRLLDERGVKYVPEIVTEGTLFVVTKDVRTYYILAREKGFEVWSDWLTPEQVIAATLGDTDATGGRQCDAGTCELINAADDLGKGTSSCMCFECGYTAIDDWWDEFKYCPNCGRRIEVDEC